MKKRMIILLAGILLVAVGINGCSSEAETDRKDSERAAAEKEVPEEDEQSKMKIGVALYSMHNEYTKRFSDAALEAAEKMGIELKLYDGNYDASKQNTQVEEMIREGVDGILLIPQDSVECAEGVESAKEAEIPLVSVNTRVDSDKISSYVGSDDVEAGELVAEGIAQALEGEGKVVILEGPIGQSAQEERIEGIKNILSEYEDIQVIGKKTANWSRMEAKSVMQKWLSTFDQIDAVIAENDDMALGALDAIGDEYQHIFVAGIDGSQEGITAVEEGRMVLTVFQNAEMQSREALEVIVKCIKGEEVESSYIIPLEEIKSE